MILFFYNTFLLLYRLILMVISPWNVKARLWLHGRRSIFEKISNDFAGNTTPVIWMHCASLGEFEQGRPLLEAMRTQYPNHKIALSFFSPSGYEVQKNYKGADIVFYMPMDGKSNAKQLLGIIKPVLVLWVKYEYWYYYLNQIKQQNIALLLVSGIFRPGQVFFKWYGSLHKKMLSFFTYLFVQNETSKQLLQTIGVEKNVSICGDTRFDRVITIAEAFEEKLLIEQFINGEPTIVAGSTWPEDVEEFNHFAKNHPYIKLIIAPHEIDEESLADTENLFKNTIRYSTLSSTKNIDGAANVLIIDNIGMLSTLYYYATIAYIGGGFGGDGVHNVLEAAVYGKPIVFGPEYDKFQEAVDLVDAGGAFSVDNALELEEVLNNLLTNKTEADMAGNASKNYVYKSKGATQKIMQHIQENRLLTN